MTPALASFPPERALDLWRKRGLAPSFNWRDSWAAASENAFAVAGLTQLDLVRSFHNAITRALREGMAFKDFQKVAKRILRRAGWIGPVEAEDPISGERREVNVGDPARLRVIFETNMSAAFQAGRSAEIDAVAAARTARGQHPGYLRFRAMRDAHNEARPGVCPTGICRKYDGLVRPIAEDGVFRFLVPPLHFQCRCTLDFLTPETLKALDYEVSRKPELSFVTHVNERTGQSFRTIRGVSPGFGHRDWAGSIKALLDAEMKVASRQNAAALRAQRKPSRNQ